MGLGYVAGAGRSTEIDAIAKYVNQASGYASNAASSASAASGSASSAKSYSEAAAKSATEVKNAVTTALGNYYTKTEIQNRCYTKTEVQNGYYTKTQVDAMMNGVQYPDGKLVFSGVSKHIWNASPDWANVTVPSTVDYVEIAGVKIARGGTGHIEFTIYAVNAATDTPVRGTATFSSSGTVSFSLTIQYGSATGGELTVNGYHYV